ncbi:MAG TPA: WD40 repeat domain-containing protein, partial [Planctomycetes bacterium]|nr:WD40 repeat domain-containing protein [Planctomycetota bacterium]
TTSETAKKAATDGEKPWRMVAFSPDGSTFAVGGDDQKVHIFDGETGRAIDVLEGHAGPLSVAAFLPDNALLTASTDKAAIIWNVEMQWKLVQRIGDGVKSDIFEDRVVSMHFSSDGKQLVTGGGEPSRSGEIKIWNVADGKLVQALKEPHSDTVFSVEFSRDGQYIASSGADRFVKVFQVADGKFVRAFEGHTHHVLGVSWSADGRTLASSGADKVVKIWDFRTGDQQRTISGFGKEVTGIKFVGDSVNVVASSGDKNVHMKKTDNGGNVRTFSGSGDYVYSVSCTADGKIIVAGGQDSVVRIWSDDGKVVVSFAPPEPEKKEEATSGGSE